MPGKIYDKTTRELLHEFARERLEPGQEFSPKDAVRWFAANYSKTKPNTVAMHIRGLAVNDPAWRRHHSHIRPGKGWDLFFKIDGDNNRFRLWDEAKDGPAQYPERSAARVEEAPDEVPDDEDEEAAAPGETAEEFARERDLRDYLAKNLGALEPGLHLYENGVEYPIDGGSIDILAENRDDLVVIELKVSKGHQRVIGQLAHYVAWVKQNTAKREGKPDRPVRGIIVASEINDKVRLAASELQSVSLFEYSISFSVRPVKD